MDKYTFGKNLYGLRNKKGLTQKELGKLLGVSDKAVSKWETGEAMPRTAKLVLITDLFGVTMEQLSSEEFDCNAEDFQINETPEQKESRYKKYFDNAMKNHYRSCKFSFVFSVVTLVISVITLIGTVLMGGVAGVSVALWEMVLAYLLPIFILIYCIILLNKIYKNKEKTGLADFIPLHIALVVFSIVFCGLGFINEITNEDIVNVIGCLITVPSLLVELKYIKSKNKGALSETKAVVILIFAILGLVISIFAHINNIVAAVILGTQLGLISGTADLLSVAIITSVLESDDTVEKKDSKKFFKKALIATIASFVVVSLLFMIFPGIGLKLTCKAMQKGQEINAQWETQDVSFKKGESKRIEMDWVSVEIPKAMEETGLKSSSDIEIRETYKIEDIVNVSLRRSTDEPFADFDLFEPKDDTEEAKLVNDLYLMNFQKYFGFIPSNMYEYQRLAANLDADDMRVIDYPQCVLYTQMIMSNQIMSIGGGNDIYYIDTDETYGELIVTDSSKIIEGSQQIGISYTIVDKNNLDVSYQIVVISQNYDMELIHKILNSVEIDL